MKDIQHELGDHYKVNPLNPPEPKKAKKGGDPEAFHKWIRDMIAKNGGKLVL